MTEGLHYISIYGKENGVDTVCSFPIEEFKALESVAQQALISAYLTAARGEASLPGNAGLVCREIISGFESDIIPFEVALGVFQTQIMDDTQFDIG